MQGEMSAQEWVRRALELQRSQRDGQVAETVLRHARDLVPNADRASLTVRTRRRIKHTRVATDDLAALTDERQFELDEGPAVLTLATEAWVRGLTEGDDRWPAWGPAALELGVGSVLALRLSVDDVVLGSLSLYSAAPDAFDGIDDDSSVVLYTRLASIGLASHREITGLRHALRTRHTIGVAQGIMRERYDLDVDAAFQLLRRYSSDLEIPVAALAERIVAERELPEIPAPG